MIIVPPAGRQPNTVLLVGEAPGREEANRKEPFVGASGFEQESYLTPHGLSAKMWRRTNVIWEYTEGNPDPTAEQIERWSPRLSEEVRSTQPKLIVTVGVFATRWFLGEDANLEITHGVPWDSGAFDSSRKNRGCGAVIVPVHHPAFAFHSDDQQAARAIIAHDYGKVAEVLHLVRSGARVPVPCDEYKGREQYADVSGKYLERQLSNANIDTIALDTEGVPSNPWSLQVTAKEGTAWILRCSRTDFGIGIQALQRYADRGGLIVLHNASTPAGCMYDIQMGRSMGLNLSRARLRDTMYGAYLLRTEPQGLKALMRRWRGMESLEYREVLGEVDKERQVQYLERIVSSTWPKPEPQIILNNDGTSRLRRPQKVERRAQNILKDFYAGKRDKDGNPVDLAKRWGGVDKPLRRMVEAELGKMPTATFDDIPLEDATYYAGRDSDATFRIDRPMQEELERRGLTGLMTDGMEVLPVFEEMQNTGMPASRAKFEQLLEDVEAELWTIQSRISHRYFNGKPFNPNSAPQVRELMAMRGLKGTKRTGKTREVSTGKPSIEHLRFTDPAISDILDWREHAKIRGTFCAPILDMLPEGEDHSTVRCNIKVSRTTTRRPSAEDPNLLNIPVRHKLGKRVRECYEAPEGEVIGGWDLSQIEMRFAAHLSQDKLLCQLFREGRDVHSETAARLFGLKVYEDAETEEERYQDVDKMDHRDPAKRCGFGILYGIGGDGLYTQLRMMDCKGWSVDRCDELIREWLKVYSGVNKAIEDTGEELRRQEYVRDVWGMYRYLPGINARHPGTAAEAKRMGFNHKVQGGAQGMIQNSMKWLKPYIWALQDAGLNVRWCLQIYDELVFRFAEDLWETMDPLVTEGLTQHCGIELRVPVLAEGHMAKSWGGLK